jgi:hypothetical protein
LGVTDHYISPVLLRRASIVTIDSILSDTHDVLVSPSVPEAAESHAKGTMSYLMTEPGAGKTPGGSCPVADDSFLRHEKYFFKDGNITFLVRDSIGPRGVHTQFID